MAQRGLLFSSVLSSDSSLCVQCANHIECHVVDHEVLIGCHCHSTKETMKQSLICGDKGEEVEEEEVEEEEEQEENSSLVFSMSTLRHGPQKVCPA